MKTLAKYFGVAVGP